MKKFSLILALLILVMPLVSAAFTLDAPANNALVNGTYNFSATITGYNDTMKCEFFRVLSGTTTEISNSSAVSSGGKSCSTNNATTSWTDSNSGYTINVTVINTTASANPVMIASTTSTGVGVDNTAATVTVILDDATIETFGTVRVTCKVTDIATLQGNFATTINWTKPDGTLGGTATGSGTEYTSIAGTDTNKQGTYNVSCQSTDRGALIGYAASQTFSAKTGGKATIIEPEKKDLEKEISIAGIKTNKKGIFLILAVILLIAGLTSQRKR